MLTICKSAKLLGHPAEQGRMLLVKGRRTFCASEGCNHTGFCANVEDDGCLKPWNLHKQILGPANGKILTNRHALVDGFLQDISST